MVDLDRKVLQLKAWLVAFHAMFVGYYWARITDPGPTPLLWLGLVFNVWMLVVWLGTVPKRRYAG